MFFSCGQELFDLETSSACVNIAMTDELSGIAKARVTLTPFDFASVNPDTVSDDDPFKPIYRTGLVLPITPSVTETLQANYDAQEIPQNNESYHVYKGSSNRQISLGNVIFPADTEEAARYALAAIHFFRVYSLSDFGVGRSGKPPSPIWFSGFGPFIFKKVPTLLTASAINHGGTDMDLLPVPSPGGTASDNDQTTQVDQNWTKASSVTNRFTTNLEQERQHEARKSNLDLNWLPPKVEIANVSLTVQHSPLFWKGFNLSDYRAGKMTEETSGW